MVQGHDSRKKQRIVGRWRDLTRRPNKW